MATHSAQHSGTNQGVAVPEYNTSTLTLRW